MANTSTTATVSWNSVAGALRYNVYRATTSGGPYVFCSAPTATSFTNVGLAPNSTYYYVVTTVVGATLDQQSSNSVEAPVTTLDAPAAPTGLTATPGSSNTQLNVSWNSVMGATSYTVSRATTSGGPYTVLSRQAGTTYANNGLTPSTTYYYVVSATVPSLGTSPNSSEASGTTLAQPAAPVAAAARVSSTSINVSWNAVTAPVRPDRQPTTSTARQHREVRTP